jgi:hypothetical protein
MAQLRFAVMFVKLVFRKNEFAIGLRVAGIAAILVERVNDQCAFDLGRRLLSFFVEHQPSAEAARGGLIRLVEHRIRPVRHDLRRRCRLVVRDVQRPDVGLRQA